MQLSQQVFDISVTTVLVVGFVSAGHSSIIVLRDGNRMIIRSNTDFDSINRHETMSLRKSCWQCRNYHSQCHWL